MNHNSTSPSSPGLLFGDISKPFSWPLILLTDLNEACQERLIDQVKHHLSADLDIHKKHYLGKDREIQIDKSDINLEIQSPSKSLLESKAQQGLHRDSQANIHAMAVQAYRSGQSHIIIADETTKRQLLGTPLQLEAREQEIITVVTVTTLQKPDSDELYIYARRTYCYYRYRIQRYNELPRTVQDLQDWGHFFPDRQPLEFLTFACIWGPIWKPPTEDQEHFSEGLILQDPDARVFSSSSRPLLQYERQANAVNEALESRLPRELVDEVMTQVLNNKVKMPVWKRAPSDTHLVIFLLFDTTNDEIARMQDEIQKAIPATFEVATTREKISSLFVNRGSPQSPLTLRRYDKIPSMTVELIPWNRHRLSTRRDLAAFWEEYRVWGGFYAMKYGLFPILFLMEPFESSESTMFGVMTNSDYSDDFYTVGQTVGRLRLGSICRSIHGAKKIDWTQGSYHDPQDRDSKWLYEEKLGHPDSPFVYNVPEWEPASANALSVAVFSLTADLSETELSRLQSKMKVTSSEAELEKMDVHAMADRPRCIYRPWNAEHDGKVKDIWKIVKEMTICESVPRNWNANFICLDRQSAVDSTVIVARCVKRFVGLRHKLLQNVSSPHMQGFEHTRVPAENARAIKSMREMDQSTECRWSYYRRPGWPGPTELPEAYVGVEHFVDGDSLP